MERKKKAAKRKRGESDEDTKTDSLTPRARNRLIVERAAEGVKQKHLAKTFNISRQRVSQIINE